MTDLLLSLGRSLLGTVADVLPIIGVLIGFQVLVLRRPIPNLRRVVFGFVMVLLGLAFFLEGLERALFPLGDLMAKQLTAPAFLGLDPADTAALQDWRSYGWVYLFACCIGFTTTVAEPSLLAVAIKANQVSGGAIGIWGLRIAVAIGVAVGVVPRRLSHRHRDPPALLHHHRLCAGPDPDLVRPARHRRPGL